MANHGYDAVVESGDAVLDSNGGVRIRFEMVVDNVYGLEVQGANKAPDANAGAISVRVADNGCHCYKTLQIVLEPNVPEEKRGRELLQARRCAERVGSSSCGLCGSPSSAWTCAGEGRCGLQSRRSVRR
jgi:hypothetical protein